MKFETPITFRNFLLFLALTLPVLAGAQEEYPQKITSVEGITEYHLENGLKVLLFPDQSKQTITVNITYLVGSKHEGYGETGMAHLLEHLVFKGTPNHKNIPKELSDHGASPNGTTWYDRTNYFETFAATEENLRWALDLESDRMINSFISKDDLESEMTVVRNEFESGENFPSSVLYKRMLSTAYLWHNYGNSTIGARSDIENVPIERLQAFYRKYYQPDNSVLLVAGKIDEEATLDLVQEYFGKIPRPERKLIKPYTEEPTQDGERFVSLRRTGDVQAVACLFHTPSGLHPDAEALEVMMRALTTQPSGRVYRNLIETKKASTVYGYNQALSDPGFTYFNANVLKESSLEEAQNTLLATLDSLAEFPLTQKEVDRAKAEISREIDLNMTNTSNIGLFLSEYIAMGDWRMLFISRDRAEAVTVEDVARVAEYYFKPSNRTVGQFIPEDNPEQVEIPRTPEIARLVDGYKGREVMDQGEAFEPTPENIEARTFQGVLDNGMNYSLLPKDTKGDVVFVQIGIRFGDEKSLEGKQMVSGLVPTMLNRGTSTKSRQEIQDLFDEYKSDVGFYGGTGRSFIRIQTTKESLLPTLNLALEVLMDPSFPENEFDALVQQRVASVEQFKSEPFSKANTALNRHMTDYPEEHIYYATTPDETIERLKTVTLDDVKSFYNEFYGGGESSTITVVGEFDIDPVKELVETKLGGWKRGIPYVRPPRQVFEGESLNEDISTPGKANAVFVVQMNLEMQDDDPDYPALYVGNYLLGGGFLNSRLATRIRQQEGLSYGVGSFFTSDGMEAFSTFGAQAIYNPENKEKLEQAFQEEIQKVITDGFTQEELDAAKSAIMQSNMVSRAQDESILVLLNNNMVFKRDMNYYIELDKRIQSLSLDQLNAAFKKHIDPAKFNVVKAGDFKEGESRP